MRETFKDIKGYETLYQISNYGRVYSKGRTILKENGQGTHEMTYQPKFLKYSTDKKGYFRTSLAKEGINKTFKIHRLVAQHFVDNPLNKPQVNHKDGNKTNNNSSNLEWVTNEENMQHAWGNGLFKSGKDHWCYGKQPKAFKGQIGKNHPMFGIRGIKNSNSKKVNQYDLEGNFIKLWHCISDVSREISVNACNISECCNGNRKTAGGYIWEYTTK